MAFIFKLEQEDGTPADLPRLDTAVPNWSAGDTIPLGGTGSFASSTYGRGRTWTTIRYSWSNPL